MEKNLELKIHKGVEVEPCTHDEPPKKSQDWPQNKSQTSLGKKKPTMEKNLDNKIHKDMEA
jgi:hypothetical protein